MTVVDLLNNGIVQALVAAGFLNFLAFWMMVFKKFPVLDLKMDNLAKTDDRILRELAGLSERLDQMPQKSTVVDLSTRLRVLEEIRMNTTNA